MQPASEVILRNRERLPTGPLLLVDAPRDGLAAALSAHPGGLRFSCQDFGDFRWHRDSGLEALFEPVPSLRGDESAVVMYLPREKARLSMALHAIAAAAADRVSLWLVGENRAGIKSSLRHLQEWFGRVATLDRARHCGLVEAVEPRAAAAFDLDDYTLSWRIGHRERELRLCSLPGVFAHGRLDPGTDMLLDALAELRPTGRVLDFACGCGVVGLALQAADAAVRPTLLDSSALALEAARRSLSLNELDAGLLPSDGLSGVSERFDWIVSNPPFHRGVRNDLAVAGGFFRDAAGILRETGRMVVVFNRHLPYAQWLGAEFGKVETLAESSEYRVLEASGKRHA